MALLFISHSSKDNELVKQYKNKIEEFGFQSTFLDIDEKDGIQINEKWEERLYKELIKSKIALCLVSKNWIESCWCQKEYSLAKTLNKETILVSIEEDPQHKKEVFQWIGEHIQQIDIADNPKAFEKVLKHIDELTKKVFDKPYAWDENKNPYPGLLPFTEDMAAVFYGREDETDAVIAELNDPKSLASVHAFLIVGASGMGKSSLLQAGILPKLKTFEEHRKKWHILPVIRPGKDPLGKLLRLLVSEAFSHSEEARDFYERLKEEIQNDRYEASMEKLFDRISFKYTDKKLLLPIDQAEEFFTVRDKKKEFFFKVLSWIFEHRDTFYTIWTIRSDQIEKFQTDASLEIVRKYHATHLLTPIKEEHISTIIKYPAYKSDIVLEESLIERMRQDLKDTKALPLLAYTLNELTKGFFEGDARQKARVVTLKEYLALAKEDENPIYAIVERKIETLLSEPKRIDTSLDKEKLLEETKRLFLYHLIDIDIDGKPSKKIAIKGELSPLMCKVADAFVQERLLVSSSVQIGDGSDTTVPTYEIAHESIIHNWPQLQEWINEEKEFFIVRAQVRVVMKEWQKADDSQKTAALLAGLLLEKAQKFLDKPWSEDEKGYIQKSIDHAKKIDRRKRNFLIGISATIIGLTGISVNGFRKARILTKKLILELILNYSQKANYFIDSCNIVKGKLFALKSIFLIEEYSNKNVFDVLTKQVGYITCYNFAKTIKVIKKNTFFTDFVFSNDEKIMYGCTDDGEIFKIDQSDYSIELLYKSKKKSQINSFKISLDNRLFYVGYNDGYFEVLSIIDNKVIFNHDFQVSIHAIVASLGEIYVATGNKIYKLYATRDEIYKLELLQKFYNDINNKERIVKYIDFTNDNRYLLIAFYDNKIHVLDRDTVLPLQVHQVHKSKVNRIKKHPKQSNLFITSSDDGSIAIWEIDDKLNDVKVKYTKNFNMGHVRDIVMSANGQTLISTTSTRELIIFNVLKRKIDEIKTYSEDNITCSAISSNNVLFAANWNKKLYVYNLNTLEAKSLIQKAHSGLWTAVSQNNKEFFATGDSNGILKLWSKKNNLVIQSFYRHHSDIYGILFFDEYSYLATISKDGGLFFWKVDGGSFSPFKKIHHNGRLYSITLNDSREEIAVSCEDGNIYIYNIKKKKYNASIYNAGNEIYSIKYLKKGVLAISNPKIHKILLIKREGNSFKLQNSIKISNAIKKIYDMAYEVSDNSLYVAASDSNIYKIKLSNDFQTKRFDVYAGHTKQVLSLQIMGNNYLVSSSRDNSIKLWSKHESRCLYTRSKAHKDRIYHLALLNDNMFISVSWDRSAKIWEIKNERLILRKTLKEYPEIDIITWKPLQIKLANGKVLRQKFFKRMKESLDRELI